MKKISCNNNVNNRKAKRDIREPKKIKSDSKQWGSVKLVSWKCKEMYLDFIWDLLKILKKVVNIACFMKLCHWRQISGKIFNDI